MSPPHVIYFEASHWPSDHMISSRPFIGQPPPEINKLTSAWAQQNEDLRAELRLGFNKWRFARLAKKNGDLQAVLGLSSKKKEIYALSSAQPWQKWRLLILARLGLEKMEIYKLRSARALKKWRFTSCAWFGLKIIEDLQAELHSGSIYKLSSAWAQQKWRFKSWARVGLNINGDLQAELGSGLKKWRFTDRACLGLLKNGNLSAEDDWGFKKSY